MRVMFSHILEEVKLLGMQGAACANEATVSPHAQVLLRIIESLAEHALPGPPVKCTFSDIAALASPSLDEARTRISGHDFP